MNNKFQRYMGMASIALAVMVGVVACQKKAAPADLIGETHIDRTDPQHPILEVELNGSVKCQDILDLLSESMISDKKFDLACTLINSRKAHLYLVPKLTNT